MGFGLSLAASREDSERRKGNERTCPALPGERRHRPCRARLLAPGHRRSVDRRSRCLRARPRVHRAGHAAIQGAHQVLRRSGAAVQPLPDRKPDRNRLSPRSEAAIGRQRRHRPYRSAGVHRHQLGTRHEGRRHRRDGAEHQSRSGGRSGPPATFARCGRPDRHRLHRHDGGEEPTCRRRSNAQGAASRPRPGTHRANLALRLDGDVAATPAPVLDGPHHRNLPALLWPRAHPRHQVLVAVDLAGGGRRSVEASQFHGARPRTAQCRGLSSERKARRRGGNRKANVHALGDRASGGLGNPALRDQAHPRRHRRDGRQRAKLRAPRCAHHRNRRRAGKPRTDAASPSGRAVHAATAAPGQA